MNKDTANPTPWTALPPEKRPNVSEVVAWLESEGVGEVGSIAGASVVKQDTTEVLVWMDRDAEPNWCALIQNC